MVYADGVLSLLMSLAEDKEGWIVQVAKGSIDCLYVDIYSVNRSSPFGDTKEKGGYNDKVPEDAGT